MSSVKENGSVLGQFIPLHYHFNMLLDVSRVQGFKKAIETLVPEGGKVVELGGGTGILSFFAAQHASKVWYVERNPELVRAARRFLPLNPNHERIEIVEGDAVNFIPPEPVDLVICEMIHVGLVREKQCGVIQAFKENYRKKFPNEKLPTFTPEASILALQPVQQNYDFAGFRAPIPMFLDPLVIQNDTLSLADPFNYHVVVYEQNSPPEFSCNTLLPITQAGTFNALRFITKNVLAVVLKDRSTIDWFSQYLVMPVEKPVEVKPGDRLQITMKYPADGVLDDLTRHLSYQVHPA